MWVSCKVMGTRNLQNTNMQCDWLVLTGLKYIRTFYAIEWCMLVCLSIYHSLTSTLGTWLLESSWPTILWHVQTKPSFGPSFAHSHSGCVLRRGINTTSETGVAKPISGFIVLLKAVLYAYMLSMHLTPKTDLFNWIYIVVNARFADRWWSWTILYNKIRVTY